MYTDKQSAVPDEWCARLLGRGVIGIEPAFALRVFMVKRVRLTKAHAPPRNHTTTNAAKPNYKREESDPRYIANASDVKLRSFTTKVHKVDTAVSYRLAGDE